MWSAGDHQQGLLLADSLLGYLERYVQRVESDFYSTLKGRIEGFPRDPASFKGSTTVTEGVCIEAVAKYIHFCSRFGPEPLYYFAYQIRISARQGLEGKCKLMVSAHIY
jgi:hypothetical protein